MPDAGLRDRIHSADAKNVALTLEDPADDSEGEEGHNVAPIAPTPFSELSIIVCFIVGLLILCVALLRRFDVRPVHLKRRTMIDHAFLHSRARANDSDHAELSRLRWQLGALGLDEARVTTFFYDGAPLNASDPLVAAAARLSRSAAAEVATLRRPVWNPTRILQKSLPPSNRTRFPRFLDRSYSLPELSDD